MIEHNKPVCDYAILPSTGIPVSIGFEYLITAVTTTILQQLYMFLTNTIMEKNRALWRKAEP